MTLTAHCVFCGEKGACFTDLKHEGNVWVCADVRACIEREVDQKEKEQTDERQNV